MNALGEQQASSRMAQVMESHVGWQPGGLQHSFVFAMERNRFQRTASRISESEVAIFPLGAREQALLSLLCAACLERPDYALRNSNNASTTLRFHFGDLKLAADALERLVHPEGASLEINIRPSEPEDFAASEGKRESEYNNRLEAIAARGLQELSRAVDIESVSLRPGDSRCVNQRRDVACDHAPSERLTERATQHSSDVGDRLRRQAVLLDFLAPLALHLVGLSLLFKQRLKLLGREFIEPDFAEHRNDVPVDDRGEALDAPWSRSCLEGVFEPAFEELCDGLSLGCHRKTTRLV